MERFMKAKYSLLLFMFFVGSITYAGPQCSDLFLNENDSRARVEAIVTHEAKVNSLQTMISAGINPLIAARVVEFYPELSGKIIEKIENKTLEMVTLYRGVSVEVSQHDPYYVRYTPGGNLIAPPFRVGINNGIFGSRNLKDAIAYTSGLMYGKSISEKGVIFELQIPKFLISQHWLSKDYFYIPRSNTPELDLWVSRYTHASLYDIGKSAEVEAKLSDYDAYYLSQKRQDLKAKNKVSAYAMRLFTLIGKFKAQF